MAQKTVLTGVKPTGQPHLGNYLGAIRPALEKAQEKDVRTLFFIADYHSLTAVHDPDVLREMSYEVAATWLACGLDPAKTLFYRQSDIPEIFELTWVLSCFSPKGLMNRAHAYKAKVAENEEAGRKDPDYGVNMGLYTYPLLMSADILMFSASEVPVGEDQVQHIEIARDIAQKFNNQYGEILQVPEFYVRKGKTVPGLDGRKMSKSYNNHIPLFLESKKLRKMVMKIKTDSSPPEAPKDPNDSLLMDLYKEFASAQEVADLEKRYLEGIGWGHVKQELFEVVDRTLAEPRERYKELMSDKAQIDALLAEGAKQTREAARELMDRVRRAIGIDR